MSSEGAGEDRDKKRALGHPGRRRILRRLPDRPVTLAEVADCVEMPLGHTKHHLDLLVSWGAVLVDGRKVNGAGERSYRRRDESDRSQSAD